MEGRLAGSNAGAGAASGVRHPRLRTPPGAEAAPPAFPICASICIEKPAGEAIHAFKAGFHA